MTQSNEIRWVRLGDYITQRREKNNNCDVPILGVTRDGFIPPKQEGADTSLYNVFYKNDFVFNPARMELNSIYLNLEYEKAICSSLYEIFYVSKPEELLPEYLNLFIKRDEFARYCWYDAMGSARNYFRVSNMQDMLIPLPSLERQQKLIDTHKGIKFLAKQNEAMAAPLMQLCQSRLQELKHKYPLTEIGPYIELCDETNAESIPYKMLGINKDKVFMPTAANVSTVDIKKYKVVKAGRFVFSGMQTGRDVCIRISLYDDTEPCLVSPAYTTFTIKENMGLMPEYFFLYFRRSEMDRLGWFVSDSSVRSNLDWNRFVDIKIPMPPVEEQQAIVNIYKCAAECKRIAEEADRLSREICPALMQKAIRG